jgi:predicted outer membrane protein
MLHLRVSSVVWLTTVLLFVGAACEDDTHSDAESRSQESDSVGQNATNDTAVAGSSAASAPGVGSGTANKADAGIDAGQGSVRLADAQIVSVLSTVNAGEVERSTIAVNSAQLARVRAFAQEVIDTRLSSQERLTRLVVSTSFAAAVNVSQAANGTSDALLTESQAIVTRLQDTDAAGFDVAFLRAQIEVLSRVLDVIDTQLLPNVQNVLLRAEVERVRAETVVLLQRARVLLAALDDDADGGVSDVDAGF